MSISAQKFYPLPVRAGALARGSGLFHFSGLCEYDHPFNQLVLTDFGL